MRQCKMCKRELPSSCCYPTQWCWICLRATAEREYSRHYYLGSKGYWEEAIELTGVCPFLEKNKELIRTVKEKYQKEKKIKNN